VDCRDLATRRNAAGGRRAPTVIHRKSRARIL
jgi:hypothetical protein